jgi:hypothetical protein
MGAEFVSAQGQYKGDRQTDRLTVEISTDPSQMYRGYFFPIRFSSATLAAKRRLPLR